MRSIGEFFARIQNKQGQEIYLRTLVSEAVKKVTTIDVPFEKVTFKGKNAVLKGVTQVEKTEIFIKKAVILREIAARSPSRVIADII